MKHQRNEVDIAIVGAGLNGLSLALALQSHGLRIALIDPQLNVTHHSHQDYRAIALAKASQQFFDGLGLWDRLKALATPIAQVHVSAVGHFAATRITAKQQQVSALGYVISAQHLHTQLMTALDSSRITCIAGSVTQIKDDASVSLQVEGANGESLHVQSRLVVAADGSRSPIRKLLQLDVESKDYQQKAIVCNVSLTRGHKGIAYERFTKKGAIAFLPISDQRAALVWTLPNVAADALLQEDDDSFLSQLQAAFGYRLGRLQGVSSRYSYPLHLLHCQQQVCGRVVIIGNAAHTLHPIAAQGLNLSLRDVALLAELLVEAAFSPEAAQQSTLLSTYQRQRQSDQRFIGQLTDGLLSIFAVDLLPVMCLRSGGLLALDVFPPARNWLARSLMGLSGQRAKLLSGLGL